jgi:hypothetical protein
MANHVTDCYLPPQLFRLFDEYALTIYDIVVVNKISTNRQADSVVVMVLETLVKQVMDGVIGEPVCYTKQNKISMTCLDDCGVNVRRICVLTGNNCTVSNDVNVTVDNKATSGNSTFKCSFCIKDKCE